MDVWLINPPWEQLKEDVRAKAKVENTMPSLGLGYIASILEAHGVKVRILDINVEGFSPKKLRDYLTNNNFRPKHIGITTTSHTILQALDVAQACKEALPKSAVTLGGVHPSIMPDETLASENVDYVIRGEGEFAYLELIRGRPLEKIEGLSYKQEGRIIHNPPRPPIADIDDLPFPAFHLMELSKYHPTIGSYKQLPLMGVIGSRGCPFNCTYCASPAFWGRKVRFRTAKNLVEEIDFLVKEYGIKEIQLLDDNFTASQKRFMEFCRLLAEAPFKISWSCNSRVDCIDDEMLKIMKATGCHSITYGIESGDIEMLKRIKKKISLEQARDAIKLTKGHRITCRTSFMFGNPGETHETIRKTVKFAMETMPDFVIYNILKPYPGTEVYHWAKERKLLDEKWYLSPDSSHIIESPGLSRKELVDLQRNSMRQFYLRPRYIISRFSRLGSFRDLLVYLKGFLKILHA